MAEHTRNPAIPSSAVCFFREGNQWCCVFGDFINLQESSSGFGRTMGEAFEILAKTKIADLGAIRDQFAKATTP